MQLKRLIVFALFFYGSLSAITAQAKYEFLPDSVILPAATALDTAIADTHIHNLTATDITLRWERHVITGLPQGVTTQVCDLNACFPIGTSTRKFNLPASASGIISLHLNNPTNSAVDAIVRLDFWEEDNPATDTIPLFYIFGAVSGTQNPIPVANVKVFPNPSSDYITVESAPDADRIRVINIYGQEMAFFSINTQSNYNIGTLPTGSYVVVVQDQKGRTIQAAEITKQ